MGILTTAIYWAYRTVSWRIAQGEIIKVKKHGLDKLQALLFQPFV